MKVPESGNLFGRASRQIGGTDGSCANHPTRRAFGAMIPGALALAGGVAQSQTADEVQAARQPSAVILGWRRSLPITYESPGINAIGGDEIRAIVSLNGSLYAVNSYNADSDALNTSLPAPQVYRLDPGGSWVVEFELPTTRRKRGLVYRAWATLRALTFSLDSKGASVNATLLAGGTFSASGLVDVFERGVNGTWTHNPISSTNPAAANGGQMRSFGTHIDAVTGQNFGFAGGDNLAAQTVGGTGLIFSGLYNSSTGLIDWNGNPELAVAATTGTGRILGFAEAGGKLYACGDAIYQRVDGPSPSWKAVYTPVINSTNVANRGCSGLTELNGELFFSVQDSRNTRIMRLDPNGGATVDLQFATFMSNFLGTPVTGGIVAYNDMTPYPTVSGTSLLMGCSVHTPDLPSIFTDSKNINAYFLMRDPAGNYTAQQVLDTSISPTPDLVAVRAMIISPFANDPAGTVYAGGFDDGNAPVGGVHNTAWLYSGTPQ